MKIGDSVKVKADADSSFAGMEGKLTHIDNEYCKVKLDKVAIAQPLWFAVREVEPMEVA